MRPSLALVKDVTIWSVVVMALEKDRWDGHVG